MKSARNPTESKTIEMVPVGIDGNPNLTELQQQVAIMLASGCSGRTIAAQLNVSEWSVSRYRQTPELRAYVNSILSEAKVGAVNRIQQLSVAAVSTIEEIMMTPSTPPAVRLMAAGKILELGGAAALPDGGLTDPAAIAAADLESEKFSALMSSLVL